MYIETLAQFANFEIADADAICGDGLLMAPTVAVARLMRPNGPTFDDFDFFELYEAFVGQVLCNLNAWESGDYCPTHLEQNSSLGRIDRSKQNVVDSILSSEHPFAAAGAHTVRTLAKLSRNSKGHKRRLISICTAGGLEVAAIIESV